METIWLVAAWTSVMLLVSGASFIVIYRKLNISSKVRLAKLHEAEDELHDELMKLDIHELKQTESGVQLLNLLSHETPQLLHRIISEQRKINYNHDSMRKDPVFTSNAKVPETILQEAARASARRDLIIAIADALKKNEDTQHSEAFILSLSSILENESADLELRNSLGKLEKLKKMIAVSESKKSAS